MISSDDTHSSTKRPSDEGKEEGGLVVSRFRIELPTNEARVGRGTLLVSSLQTFKLWPNPCSHN